jgi:hypothetical protein
MKRGCSGRIAGYPEVIFELPVMLSESSNMDGEVSQNPGTALRQLLLQFR